MVLLLSPFERADRRQVLELGVSAKTFRLDCAPIVNLFPQTAEPILLSHARFDYPVIPDVNRRTSMEVFQINDVVSASPGDQEVIQFEPFYSFRHGASRSKVQAFWHAKRRPSGFRDDEGTEVYLSLVDLSCRPVPPRSWIRSRCAPSAPTATFPRGCPSATKPGDFELDGAAAGEEHRGAASNPPTPCVRPPARIRSGV